MTPSPQSPEPAPLLTPNVKGALWMLVAVTLLTTMMAVIKHLTKSLPVMEVAMFRMAMGLPFYLPWVLRTGWRGMRTDRPWTHFWRGVFGSISLLCMTYALAHLLLADATVLTFTVPLWMIVLSALFLGERVRMRRTIATICGFVGVVLVVQPQGGIAPAALVAILGAILACTAVMIMKSLTRTDPPDRIVVYFLLVGTLVLIGPAIWVWQWPGLREWGWLVVLGLLGSSGQYMLTRAYGNGELTIVAPLDFLRVVIAGVMGYFLFDELPDAWGFAGATVIVLACIYIVRRDAMLRRPAPAPAPAE